MQYAYRNEYWYEMNNKLKPNWTQHEIRHSIIPEIAWVNIDYRQEKINITDRDGFLNFWRRKTKYDCKSCDDNGSALASNIAGEFDASSNLESGVSMKKASMGRPMDNLHCRPAVCLYFVALLRSSRSKRSSRTNMAECGWHVGLQVIVRKLTQLLVAITVRHIVPAFGKLDYWRSVLTVTWRSGRLCDPCVHLNAYGQLYQIPSAGTSISSVPVVVLRGVESKRSIKSDSYLL